MFEQNIAIIDRKIGGYEKWQRTRHQMHLTLQMQIMQTMRQMRAMHQTRAMHQMQAMQTTALTEQATPAMLRMLKTRLLTKLTANFQTATQNKNGNRSSIE